MSVDLASAVAPAAAALAASAYINAKASITYDLGLLYGTFQGLGRLLYRQRADRINLFYILESWSTSKSHVNKPFLIFQGRTTTYGETYDKVLRYGNWFREAHGVRPGDIVAIYLQNSDTFILIWLALWSIGAKPAFINYNLTGRGLVHCIKVATTKLCMIDPAVAENFDEDVCSQLSDVNCFIFTPEAEGQASAADPVRAPDEDRSQASYTDMAMLVYTSGTTGLPKPAIVSWAKCTGGSSLLPKILHLGSDEIIYTCMPLYHSSAAVLSFLVVLQYGNTQALGRKFSTTTFWDEVRASNATIIQYVGETLRYLLATPTKYDPTSGEPLDRKHSVHTAYGNGLRPDVWNRFKDRFGIDTIMELYAATEGTFATLNRSSNDFSMGAIGRSGWLYNAIFNRKLSLVEVDWTIEAPLRDPKTGFCKKVKAGEPGEVISQLDPNNINARFQGYYNNPDATSKKILRDVFTKGDAYYRTGDVVRWDSDGLIFFHDRIGDTFRWKSENVSTTEVSQVVGLHPSVREANVYGVQLPHHDGRAGCAAVSLAAVDEATLRSIAEHVRASLPRYAAPLFLRVLEGDPGGQSTGTMKQQKVSLRQAGVKPNGPGSMFWLRNDTYVPFREKEWQELEGGRTKL